MGATALHRRSLRALAAESRVSRLAAFWTSRTVTFATFVQEGPPRFHVTLVPVVPLVSVGRQPPRPCHLQDRAPAEAGAQIRLRVNSCL
ncbi:MAG TPA: hypothetical protein VK391_03765, partial [Allosphingosinicella sp.]|nr:hypothetical protein [Allosphingosinicella sp.]